MFTLQPGGYAMLSPCPDKDDRSDLTPLARFTDL
jgi:hypothetical protein